MKSRKVIESRALRGASHETPVKMKQAGRFMTQPVSDFRQYFTKYLNQRYKDL